MSATPPTPLSRPRAVNVAFWLWIGADVLTAAFGLLLLTSPASDVHQSRGRSVSSRWVWPTASCAGRARGGSKRFEAAGVALSLTSVALLAILLLFGASLIAVIIVAAIMVLTITGSAMMQGKPAQAWFDGEETTVDRGR